MFPVFGILLIHTKGNTKMRYYINNARNEHQKIKAETNKLQNLTLYQRNWPKLLFLPAVNIFNLNADVK